MSSHIDATITRMLQDAEEKVQKLVSEKEAALKHRSANERAKIAAERKEMLSEIERERAKLYVERQSLTEKRQNWEAFDEQLKKQFCDPEDVIDINVGGEYFTTSRATMTKYPDTMLAALFGGRHAVSTDKNGRIFLDRNPTHFRSILEWLRSDILPQIPAADQAAFYNEVDFYQLPLVPPPDLPNSPPQVEWVPCTDVDELSIGLSVRVAANPRSGCNPNAFTDRLKEGIVQDFVFIGSNFAAVRFPDGGEYGYRCVDLDIKKTRPVSVWNCQHCGCPNPNPNGPQPAPPTSGGQPIGSSRQPGMNGANPSPAPRATAHGLIDASTKKCMNQRCNTPFGQFECRHHCFMCGGVFCNYCTSRRATVYGLSGKRVCNECYFTCPEGKNGY